MTALGVRIALGSLCLAALLLGPLAPALAASAPEGQSAAQAGAPIDINKATEVELAKLQGIGEAMAKRIVDFRKEHGPFQRVEDLMKVKGIGEKSFEKLRPSITVGRAEAR